MAKKITDDGEIVNEFTYETVARRPPFFKTPHNHDTDREAASVALECKDASRTQQQFAKDAEINNILAQFLKTGEPSLLGVGNPIYRDIMEEFDLQTIMVTGHEVETAWKALSPEVRNTLKDPLTFANYVDHCLQRGDVEPLRNLGLAPKVEPPVKLMEASPAPTSTPAGTPVAGATNGAPAP